MKIGCVYFRNPPRYVFGPLGIWEIADEEDLPGVGTLVVCAIDPDGAAVAYDKAWLIEEAKTMQKYQESWSWEDEANKYRSVRTCYPWDWCTPRQQAQLRGIWKANQDWWDSVGQHTT